MPVNDSIQAFFLGILQGITEFLPISSSAHLILLPWLVGWEAMGTDLRRGGARGNAIGFGNLFSPAMEGDWKAVLESLNEAVSSLGIRSPGRAGGGHAAGRCSWRFV